MGRHLRQVTSLFRISPRDVCFIAISIAFMQLFPVPQEHPCNAEQWLNERANRVVARVVVETFGGCSTPPTRSRARLAGTDTVEFLRETDDGEVRRSMLAFGTDVLFGIGVRVWFVFTLFILIYGIAGGGLGVRILAIGASALGYCLCFALRGAALGMVAASVDLVPLIRFVDPPLRIVVLFSAILSVGFAHAMALRIRDDFRRRNAAKGLSAALVLALPWVVAGCKDGFSNNSITINVSGGEGFMPYLAMVALVVWQQYRERRRRRDGPELPRVRVASVEEGAAGEIARGIVPYLGGRPKKGRQPAFTQKAVAVLCGKDVNTVARWESGAIKPPLDYTAELRVKGGIAFFDWVREYNAHNGVADIFVQIQKGNVVYTEGLTEREKGLVEEYIQELRQG